MTPTRRAMLPMTLPLLCSMVLAASVGACTVTTGSGRSDVSSSADSGTPPDGGFTVADVGSDAATPETTSDTGPTSDGAANDSADAAPDAGPGTDATADVATADVAADSSAGECKTDKDCDDFSACTVDICGSDHSCKHVPQGGACDDQNPCTLGDACQGGTCTGSPKSCPDTNPCTDDFCDAGTGACSHLFNTDPCDDLDPCTTTDACSAGTCTGSAKVCDDSDPCTADACDPAKGACVTQPTADGASCQDGDACTENDTCLGGKCQAGAAKACDDGKPCTADACLLGACANTPTTAPCDDQNPCTENDACKGGSCQSGTPKSCDDGKPCTSDVCLPATGLCDHTPVNGLCNDQSACTTGDLCANGECVGVPKDCTDGKPCTSDLCDKATGACSHPATIGACDDGDPCTVGETCQGGACQGGGLNPCDDADACTTDACAPGTGCTHTAKDCDDGKGCSTDACDKATGACSHVARTGGCLPNEPCYVLGSCEGLVCKPTQKLACTDANPCTDDSCDLVTGACSSAPVAAPTACTTAACSPGACAAGVCVAGGATPVCDDKNACTVDACSADYGCSHVAIKCDDQNPCTTDACDKATGVCSNVAVAAGTSCAKSACETATCTGTACKVTAVTDCSDTNPCTDDGCSPAGCTHTPKSCTDGLLCTIDTCDPVTGCASSASSTFCDDEIGCSTDACVPGYGCAHTYPAGCCASRPLMEGFDGDGDLQKWALSPDTGPVGWWWLRPVSYGATGQGVMYYGDPLTGTYDSPGVSNFGWLASPWFVVPKTASVKLQFYGYLGLETLGSVDRFQVVVFVDGVPKGDILWDKNEETFTAEDANTWKRFHFDLTAYAGKTVHVEFVIDTVDAQANDGFGVLLDDVRVLGCD